MFFFNVKNRNGSRALACVLAATFCLLTVFAFVGCKTDDDGEIPRFGAKVSGAEFSGTWSSTFGEEIVIDTTANTFKYSSTYDGATFGFEGAIVGEALADKTLLQSKYGYLTIKITNGSAWGLTDNNFYVIHWKDLTTTTVQESSAYKKDGQSSGMATLQDAVAEYTIDNGYFAAFSTCTKQ